MTRAIVLAGGLGMRLRPYTAVLPKPLMPIGDRPVLDIVVRQLHHHEFEPRHHRHRLPGRADRGVLPRRAGLRHPDRLPPRALAAGHRRRDRLHRGPPGRLHGDERRRPHRPRLHGADGGPQGERRRRDDRHDQARGPDLPRRAALHRPAPARPADRLRREALDGLRGLDGRLRLLAEGPRVHRGGRVPRLPRTSSAACSTPASSSAATARTATGWTSAATTTTRRPSTSSSACAPGSSPARATTATGAAGCDRRTVAERREDARRSGEERRETEVPEKSSVVPLKRRARELSLASASAARASSMR